ncbi:MAG: hypothetical protein ACRC42_00370, partial [Mycoplasma sp.]
CTTTTNISENNQYCTKCFEGNSFIENNLRNCFSTSSLSQMNPTYYLDQSDNTFKKCHNNCGSCTQKGDDNTNLCTSCDKNKNMHFIIHSPTNCVSPPGDGYYLVTSNNTYVPCWDTCTSCFNIGSEEDHKCNRCISNYIFTEDRFKCIERTSNPDDYFWDDSDGEPIFKKCHKNCLVCHQQGNDEYNKCDKCTSDRAFLYGGIEGNCILISQMPEDSYWENNEYKKCHEDCEKCSQGGTELSSNCDRCKNGLYAKEGEGNCYHKEDKPDGFYYDEDNRVFKKCFENCQVCVIGPTEQANNCVSCKKNSYFISTHPTNCVDINDMPANYYKDEINNIYKPCSTNCTTCQKGEESKEVTNCWTCWNDYHFIIPKINGKCIHKDDKPSNYYWDENDTFNKCYETCSLCNKGGNALSHHCTACLNDDYHWEDIHKINCVTSENQPPNTYLDKEDNTYKPCHTNCTECIKPDDEYSSNCVKCISDYFFIDSVELGNCISKSDKPTNYYLDDSKLVYLPCYKSCNTCSAYGNLANNNCDWCINEYYWWNDKSTKQCINQQPDNYFLDKSDNTYKPCSKNCTSCIKGESEVSSNCEICHDDYFFIGVIDWGNCIHRNDKPLNYYYDGNSVKPCHAKCQTCEIGFTSDSNNCLTCIENNFFENEASKNCIDYIPDGYYRDGNVLKWCHENCFQCNIGADIKNDIHNCITCKNELHWIEGKDTNCIREADKPLSYYWDVSLDKYRPCHDNCSLCKIGPTINDNNCDVCKDDLFWVEPIDKGNCMLIKEIPNDHYFDDDDKIIKKCYDTCNKCKVGYNEVTGEHNCIQCKNSFFYESVTSSNCINIIYEGHYLYKGDNKSYLKPCYESCSFCHGEGNEVKNNCSKCKQDYFWIEDKPNNCINHQQINENYYLDIYDNTFKKCHKNCKTCSIQGNNEINNCDSCASDRFFIEPKYKGNCDLKSDIPSDYY